ncbi:MAG TPA: hypothetical protein PLD20_34720 [Blastocatellia bacterium]|nr:hypothetical protein [Blastocatellia bacterium]HMV85790.1 hypothetical protein [Blastocatellia bacterium]HMX29034.1 hypothetical protein [Blastocatellia bacterium]HMY72656.1 hypothetical protein [Blastocatellia bacterium]HMZ23130.1 hypothetical protein [Blastocatellia bacterium]
MTPNQIDNLVNGYRRIVDAMNNAYPADGNLENLLKAQLRHLALYGGPNGQPLKPSDPSPENAERIAQLKDAMAQARDAVKAIDYGCEEGWIHCAGGCVPPEVGCEGGAA